MEEVTTDFSVGIGKGAVWFPEGCRIWQKDTKNNGSSDELLQSFLLWPSSHTCICPFISTIRPTEFEPQEYIADGMNEGWNLLCIDVDEDGDNDVRDLGCRRRSFSALFLFGAFFWPLTPD